MKLDKFISAAGQQCIVEAIEQAEQATSGEIRVHVEPRCTSGDAYKRAVEKFNELKMYATERRNGVLIYIAFESRCFAIIGDSGINEVVPSDFWDSEKNLLAQYLRSGDATTGICLVIEAIGENLAKFFPPVDNDINEQPNEISYDEN